MHVVDLVGWLQVVTVTYRYMHVVDLVGWLQVVTVTCRPYKTLPPACFTPSMPHARMLRAAEPHARRGLCGP